MVFRQTPLALRLVASLALLARLASAQIGGAGTLKGTVTDASGALVPGATVTALHLSTGTESRRESTAAGLFVVTPLAPGAYKVTVTANGFRGFVQENVIIDALTTVEIAAKLEVGSTAESLTVSAAPPELNTSDARMGQTMRNEVYTALPLSMGGGNPRNPAAFIYLMPGVQEGGTFGFINGGQSFSKDVYIEGLPITDAVRQGESRALQYAVSVESVEQFQVETSGQSVEFNGQGSENYSVKSGTNQFHGSVYEYLRNTKFDARGFFSPTRPQQNQNQYGFTFGGPIRRNKLFFFGAYDGFKYRVGTPFQLVTVPTARMRTGDFGELPQAVFDPLTTNCPGGVNCSRQQFAGNVIPVSRLSPASRFLQEPLPMPTQAGIAANYLANNPGVGFNNFNVTAKVDWNANDAHRFTVLYTHGKHDQSSAIRGNPLPLPLPYTVTRLVEEVPTVGQLKHSWVINPSMMNQISYGVSRLNVPISNPTIDGKWVEKAGIKGLPPGDATQSFPEVSFAGPNAPAGWRGTDARPFLDALNTFTFQDSFQWIRGAHSVKAGYQHQRLQNNYRARMDGTLFTSAFSNAQTAGFTNGALNNATGNAYASYLMGTLNSATVIEDSVVTSGARFRNHAWWIGDDWKVSSKLTVNLGLRHDIMLPYVEVVDRVSWFNPDIVNPLLEGGFKGALQFGGQGADPLYCNCSTRIKTHWNNWGPRVGFAYRIGSKTVVRSGYGIMYSRHGAVGGRGGAREGTGKLGFTASPGFPSLDTFSPAFDWDDGVPAYQKPPFFNSTLNTGFITTQPSGGGVAFDNPNEGARPPRYQNWNFSIQRTIGGSMTLTAGYVGSNGKLLRGGGLGIWSGQIHPRYLALGNLLTAQVNATSLAQARAIVPDVTLPYTNFRGTFAQMLRPFPQYSGVNADFVNLANSNYNSLQLTLQKRMANGLTFNINHTWSKTLSDANAGRSGYFWQNEKSHGESDRRHVFNGMLVYQTKFALQSAWAKAAVNGWRVSSITRIRSGLPYGIIAASCTLPNAGGCRASYAPGFTGAVRINGEWGSGDLLGARPIFVDRNAFRNPAPYTYGDTPAAGAYGLVGPGFWNEDMSVTRQFTVKEKFKVDFTVEGFNVTNAVAFSGPASLDINNANFGRITSQQNSPRSLQMALKLSF
jgi:hypothetical protein